ncbi:hypothetical protein E4U53_000899 [Claviceps sorghi]|nr:hypothetical protein E4U53_000899 [Claviceps sorghi]
MRPPGKAVAAWHILLSSLVWTAAVLAKEEPTLAATKFHHPPRHIYYFEDSDVIVFPEKTTKNVWRSTDAGVSWKRVEAVPDGQALDLIMHPHERNRAYIVTPSKTHFRTEDRGETWTKFEIDGLPSKFQPEVMTFHAGEPDRIIFNAMNCDGIFCNEQAKYTIDGFKTTQVLRVNTAGCWWAKSNPEFTTGDAEKDRSRVLCIVAESLSFFRQEQRLVVSDSFFAVKGKDIQEFEPNLDTNKAVAGSLNLAVVKKYILLARSSSRSDEMSLYVTDDTLKWHRAMFPKDDNHDHSHRINQGAYTVLESTNYSIQVDVMTSHPSRPMGVLFTSNSNGTYFTENVPYTNRNSRGNVDFEKISGIQGIFLVNTVENGAQVSKHRKKDKIIVTQITFDDGRTFSEIKAGDDRLHLHSVTELDNLGRIFSSPAPGLVMGNGNTGRSLGHFKKSHLYVSDDAGSTWKKALDGPHKYEFGDSGSILVAIKDSDSANIHDFSYSLDHGDNWKKVSLPDGLRIKPVLLTTTQDSTSAKFLLLGEADGTFHMIAINFDGIKERTCEDKDMEDWHARTDKDGNPTCVMGHKQTYRRRKKTADCFIKQEFKDPVPKTEDCECTDADFECDYNFQRDPADNKKCIPAGPVSSPDDGYCKEHPDGSFKGSSGWRLIPGNTCKRTKGKQKDDKTERKCSEAGHDKKPSQPPATGEISRKEKVFDFKLKGFEKLYLEKGEASSSADETVIAWPAADSRQENQIWLSHDHGKEWKRILEGEEIRGIFPHRHFSDVVYFTTNDKEHKIIYTIDRGHSFHTFKAPGKSRAGVMPFGFHHDKKDWLLWMGSFCDKVGNQETCFDQVWVSTNRGDKWDKMLSYAEKCEFTGNSAYKFRDEKQVVCLAKSEERLDANTTIKTSDDFFADRDKAFTYDREVINFATMSEFIILNAKDPETGAERAVTSLDGKDFEAARYPHNFHQGHHDEYTLLDSSTHAVNLFVRSEAGKERSFGSIIKSNSNGTSYVLSAANVNSDENMYVDFEKVSGVEGVVLINVVANAAKKDERKKVLQTKISHSDGSQWGYLPPPAKDVDGKSYSCSSAKGDEHCALHLHHYTEREDKRRTFAADTAVGFMFGVGNVGSSLGDIKDADTFLTTDGGITWTSVKKGHWTWQYGDQGSIMVLVQRATPKNPAVTTKTVSYSTDEGKTWKDVEFYDKEVTVMDITTLSSGTSRNFLIWCQDGDKKMIAVNLDFGGLADKACQYNKDSEAESDYSLWTPKHPLQSDDCVFGHKARYLRKKADRKCFNHGQNLKRLVDYENCECKREDFEW